MPEHGDATTVVTIYVQRPADMAEAERVISNLAEDLEPSWYTHVTVGREGPGGQEQLTRSFKGDVSQAVKERLAGIDLPFRVEVKTLPRSE